MKTLSKYGNWKVDKALKEKGEKILKSRVERIVPYIKSPLASWKNLNGTALEKYRSRVSQKFAVNLLVSDLLAHGCSEKS